MTSKDETICIHAWISGRVQGVYFRDHTCRKAISLNLLGWVKNLPDQRVELMALGSKEKIQEFVDWLWIGSPSSKVSEVCWEVIPQQNFTDFIILR